MRISLESIGAYFAQIEPLHWFPFGGAEPIDGVWHLVYHGVLRDFHIYVVFDAEWIYLQCPLPAPPKAPARAYPIAEECRRVLTDYLLKLNSHLFMAKFALDEEGQILLSVDIPTSILNPSTFRLAAEAMTTYMERYCYEIQVLAQDPHVAQLLQQHTGAP